MTTNRSSVPLPGIAPRGDLGRLCDVLGYQLTRAALSADAVFESVAAAAPLRKVEYAVLMLIAENPGMSPADIARALAVTPPHITAVVDRLASRALVTRAASTRSRRGQSLSPTHAGRELARTTTDAILLQERALGLTPGERAILTELLHKVATAPRQAPQEVRVEPAPRGAAPAAPRRRKAAAR